MSQKQQSFFASLIIIFVMVSCRANGNPVSTNTIYPTQTATTQPVVFTLPTLTVSAANDLFRIFPSFSLTDPNTVCVQHYLEALSCLDETGWHIYKDGIPDKIVQCTDGRIYLDDDEIYQYLIESETRISIGGWVDQGTVLCGRGNEIWVSDYSGVMRYDGSTWTNYSVEDFFESHDDEWPDSVHSLAVAPNGNAWVITNNTISTFNGSEWEVVTPPGNYFFNQSTDWNQHLVIDSSGAVWIGANTESCCFDDQLLKLDRAEWSVFPAPDVDNEMSSIVVDNKNRIWASTNEDKIFMLNPDTNIWELRYDVKQLGSGNEWELRFEGNQLGLGFGDANRIRQMEFDGQGRLWVTTNYGLGIYDGMTWTIYHDYTANLYISEISGLYILGDGPQLPAPKYKPFGSIRGKLVSDTQTPFTDALVEICIKTHTGLTFCSDQTRSESVNANGSFIISNVPAGIYGLKFKISNEWYDTLGSEQDLCFPYCTLSITVIEGEETNLGEITAP